MHDEPGRFGNGPPPPEEDYFGRGRRGERRRSHLSWQEEEKEKSPWYNEDLAYLRERRFGGRRERLERGMLRYLLLDALRHGPKHGYEVIKWLEEQTNGGYAPSPGTVYPTLQFLQDQGMIQAQREHERSTYHLTEAGQAELNTRADFIKDFWGRHECPAILTSAQPEIEFLQEELHDLSRTVGKGLHTILHYGDTQAIQQMRRVLERSRNEIRDIITQNVSPQRIHDKQAEYRHMASRQDIETAITHMFAAEDEVLRKIIATAREQGLPAIAISPMQGKLLQILARACNARAILEIGSLAGYSGVWLARALPPEGRLITLEINPKHAEIVQQTFLHANLADRAEVRLGAALEMLPHLEREGPFDMIFIDADKAPYPQYLEWAVRLSRPGSLIVADNCVREGAALRPQETASQDLAGLIEYNKRVSSHPALQAIALPIGDGMTVAVVVESENK